MAEVMRVSDEQREQVVRDLTRHCGDGRLTLDELEDRIAEAYAAVSSAELDHALRDLPRSASPAPRPMPVVETVPLPARRHTASPATVKHGAEVALRIHVAVYLSVIAFLTVIWFLTSPFGYFWPIWPAMGWGLAIAIQAGVTKAACGSR
jgi:hypothetical protein